MITYIFMFLNCEPSWSVKALKVTVFFMYINSFVVVVIFANLSLCLVDKGSHRPPLGAQRAN